MTEISPPPASLRLRIDTQALADNWRAMDRMSGSAEAGAAVKADAYGLGVDLIMPALVKAGARTFFVAHWGEVSDVAKHTGAGNIAVLHGVLNAAEAAFAKAVGAVPVINSLHQAQIWNEAGGGRCHLMVDSGMNRLGVEPAHLSDPAIQALNVDILMSHLASADENTGQNARQLERFQAASLQINARSLSLANSAGTALGEDYHFNLTRPGLALYGGIPRPEFEGLIQQIAHIEAAVLQIRDVLPGESVGYNAKWTAKEKTRVAIISLGYADGILRSHGAAGAVHHGDTRLPVLGRISMDMVIVNCDKIDVREGDFCRLFYHLPQVAKSSGLSQYELLTVLGSRFGREISTG